MPSTYGAQILLRTLRMRASCASARGCYDPTHLLRPDMMGPGPSCPARVSRHCVQPGSPGRSPATTTCSGCGVSRPQPHPVLDAESVARNHNLFWMRSQSPSTTTCSGCRVSRPQPQPVLDAAGAATESDRPREKRHPTRRRRDERPPERSQDRRAPTRA